MVEKFTARDPKTVDGKSLRFEFQADQVQGGVQAIDEESAPIEMVITETSEGREELIFAVRAMMERINMPIEVLTELAGDKEGMKKVNDLASEYVVAVKALDLTKQAELAKSLQVLLG